jgi:hypothetical protein
MSERKLTDKAAFESLIRFGRRTNKVNWTLSGDQSDVDDLNAAIRKASGRGEPEPVGEKFPWTSLESGVGDEK